MDVVERQRQRLLEEIQTLPVNLLQEATEYLSRLKEKANDGSQIDGPSEEEDKDIELELSPYEAFEKAGLIGCIEDAPPDLAANYKAYLAEGWAEKYGNR